jgi:phage tail-like protein
MFGAFETILFDGTSESPGLAHVIAALPQVADPMRTRPEFLPWLAGWVGLELPPDLPVDVQRELVAHATSLYRRRGTRAGLQHLLDIVTGGRARVEEPDVTGFRVGSAAVGRTTRVGRDRPHYFEVVVDVGGSDGPAAERLERLTRFFVDLSKPAHTQYALTVVDGPDRGRRAG